MKHLTNLRYDSSFTRNYDGFTVVEVLVSIIVIGVIIGVAVTAFNDIRQRDRNTERHNDINTVQDALEDFYAQKERYPSLAEINDKTWRTKNLKTLQEDHIKDPRAKNAALVMTPGENVYGYFVTSNDGTVCDNQTKDCTKYTLTATLEGGSMYSKNNYN